MLIDLHNSHPDDVIVDFEKALNTAIIKKQEKLEVIHGIGSGNLKNEIHNLLRSLYAEVINRFELDSQNPGKTIIYL